MAATPPDEREAIVNAVMAAVRALIIQLRAEIGQMPVVGSQDASAGGRPDPQLFSAGPRNTLTDAARATARFGALAELMFEVERAAETRPRMRDVRAAALEAQGAAQALMALRSRTEAEARWPAVQQALRQVLGALQTWARKEREVEKRAGILREQRTALVEHTKAAVALVRAVSELAAATDERVYVERGQTLVRHVSKLMDIAHQLGARALETALREAMLSFFAAAKLAFRTRTAPSLAALEGAREAFLRAFVPLLAALKSPESLETDDAALRPTATPAQEDKKQRTMRALHVSRVVVLPRQANADPPHVARAKAALPRVVALQRHIRAWLRRSRWPRLVRHVQDSPAAQPARLRFRAMHEVYTSERAYLFALTTLQGVWLEKAHRAPRVWQAGDVETVWGNVAAIRTLTIDLVADLRRAYNAFPGPAGSVGAVFLKYGPWLRLYQQYIAHFNRALSRLTDVVAKRAGYAAYVDECLAETTRTNQAVLELGAFLIMPVQRVPRHELLLRTLLKYTPDDHVEHAALVGALRAVKEVNERTNAVNTDLDAFAAPPAAAGDDERPPAVQGLSEVPGTHKAKLVAKVHAAERGAPPREALALLFREVLVVARRVDAGLYAVQWQLGTRGGLRLQESVPDMGALRFGLDVEDRAGVALVLFLRSADERRAWVAALRSLMKSAQFDDLLSLVSFKAQG